MNVLHDLLVFFLGLILGMPMPLVSASRYPLRTAIWLLCMVGALGYLLTEPAP